MPELALGEGKGLGLLWWMVLQPQAKTVILYRLCQPRLLPYSRLLHAVDPSKGRQIPVNWLGFVCSIYFTLSSSFNTGNKCSLILSL